MIVSFIVWIICSKKLVSNHHLDLIVERLARPPTLVQLIDWLGTWGVKEMKWYEHLCGKVPS
jgi:hypothetical protein